MTKIYSVGQSHLQWSTYEFTPGSQVNDSRGFAVDPNGNTFAINFTQSNTSFWFSYRFFCYSPMGILLWQFDNDSCFTNCQDIYKNVIPLHNGAIFIGTYNDVGGANQIRFKRIDLNGTLLWQKYWSYPRLSPRYPLVTRLDASGNIIIGFSAFGAPDFSENFAFAKFDTLAGNELWHFELPDQSSVTSATLDESFRDLETDANGNCYFTGDATNPFLNVFRKYYFSVSPGGQLNYSGQTNFSLNTGTNPDDLALNGTGSFGHLVPFINSNVVFGQDTTGGFFKWTTGIQHDSASIFPIQLLFDGSNYFVLSNFNYFIPDSSFAGGFHTNFHYCITKIDTLGNKLWQKDYFTNSDSSSLQNGTGGAAGMVYCNNALYITSDEFTDPLTIKMMLHKIDTSGVSLWTDTTSFAGASLPLADDLCNIYVSRSTQNNASGYLTTLTQKFSDTPLSANPIEGAENAFQLYPNPANNCLYITSKSNVATQKVILKIIDATGTIVFEQPVVVPTTIRFDKLKSGFYTAIIVGNSGLVSKHKIVIGH